MVPADPVVVGGFFVFGEQADRAHVSMRHATISKMATGAIFFLIVQFPPISSGGLRSCGEEFCSLGKIRMEYFFEKSHGIPACVWPITVNSLYYISRIKYMRRAIAEASNFMADKLAEPSRFFLEVSLSQ